MTENYKYEDCIPVEPYLRTVWLITEKHEEGHRELLTVWHQRARIEDIVSAHKATNPGLEFVVNAFDVGTIEISKTLHSMSNGRGVNQNLFMEIL